MKKQKILLIVPFAVVILGMIGYILGEHYTIYAAFLASLKLLKVHLDPLPAGNITLELARWTGVLFFFSLIYTTGTARTRRCWREDWAGRGCCPTTGRPTKRRRRSSCTRKMRIP